MYETPLNFPLTRPDTSPLEDGDQYTGNGVIYTYNNGVWDGSVDINGYTGSEGAIGYTGSEGAIGYTGSEGAIGYTGSEGAIGYTGSEGAIGYTGSEGAIGYTGSEGAIGYTGSEGAIGYTGSEGGIGYTGSEGGIGYVGSEGYTGSAGTNGSNGYTGSAGSAGIASLSSLTSTISWSVLGVNPPTFNVSSTGTKLLLWPAESATMVDYAVGIESSSLWSSIPNTTGNFAFKWYAGTTTIAILSNTGTITANKFVGDGSSLTNVTVNIAGNIIGTGTNVSLVAGSYSYLFDNTGTFTMPANGDIVMTGTNSILSVSGTALLGGYTQVGGYYSTLGISYPGGNTQYGMTLRPAADNTNAITFLNAAGTNIGSITQTTSTVVFTGDGSGLTNLPGVVNKTSGSWTVAIGTGTYSITVPASGTYQIWVRGNIPNGIIAYNATAVVTNTNVPVVGAQYAWVYSGGGTPIDFTSIPNQFTGTNSTIVRSSTAPSATTNRFDFGINNTSTSTQIVYWGYVTL